MSRERLLDAALRVYESDGFRGATTRRIAEAAGVNEITIFRLFGSKAALIDEALRRESEEIPPPLIRLPETPVNPERELTAWCVARRQHISSRRTLILKTLAEATNPSVTPCGQAERECAHRELESYAGRLADAGFIELHGSRRARTDQIDTAVAMLMATLFTDAVGRDMMPHLYPQPAHRAPVLYSRLFLRALGAHGASSRQTAPSASSATAS